MTNSCSGKNLLHEGICIFTNTTTFVKILIGYVTMDLKITGLTGIC